MFAGMTVFVIVIPLNGYLMKLIEKADESRMEAKDKRIKLMNEILNGIKVRANITHLHVTYESFMNDFYVFFVLCYA